MNEQAWHILISPTRENGAGQYKYKATYKMCSRIIVFCNWSQKPITFHVYRKVQRKQLIKNKKTLSNNFPPENKATLTLSLQRGNVMQLPKFYTLVPSPMTLLHWWIWSQLKYRSLCTKSSQIFMYMADPSWVAYKGEDIHSMDGFM